ncbi:MAG: hypothetical protein KA419_08135 [Acidobacteria bacterium]|nr:hypothetical protein [Acidobacteriota bacterium]
MRIDLVPLMSPLHTPDRLGGQAAWLRRVEASGRFRFRDHPADDVPRGPLAVVWVRTGGTERQFVERFPLLKGPVFLLANPGENSLAAALEILAWVRSRGRDGEILHGDPVGIGRRLALLGRCAAARSRLGRERLGVIGEPSDWLIASRADARLVKERWGARIRDVSLEELVRHCRREGQTPSGEGDAAWTDGGDGTGPTPGTRALRAALLSVARAHRLTGLTLRCFDLLGTLRETGCIPLAQLNDAGFPAACEGDVPSLFTMVLGRHLGAGAAFMCNPAEADLAAGEMVLAHCTVPLSMTTSRTVDTHFESGLGAAIRGTLPPGPCTLVRAGGPALDRFWVAPGAILENLRRPDLCRTQVRVRLDSGLAEMFDDPLGNHRVLFLGDHAGAFRAFLRYFAPPAR